MSKLVRSATVTALLCLLALAPVLAQQAEPDAAEAPQPTPIPPAQIAGRALETAALLRVAATNSDLGGELQSIRDAFLGKQKQIEELRKETARRMKAGGPVSIIEESERDWSRIQDRLTGWLRALSSRAEELGATLEQVRSEQDLWKLTRSAVSSGDMPPALNDEIRETLALIQTVEKQVRTARDSVLDFQSSVGKAKAETDEVLAVLDKEITKRGKTLIKPDSPPIWESLGDTGADGGFSEQIAAMWQTNQTSVRRYVKERRFHLLWQLFLFVALAVLLAFLRQKARVWVQQDRSLEPTAALLAYPIAASLIITLMFSALIDPSAPNGWTAVLGFVLLASILRLLPKALPETNRSWAYLLALLVLLQQTVKLTPDGILLNRLALLLLSVTGIAVSCWIGSRKGLARLGAATGWLRAIKFGAWLTAALFAIGTVANIVGSVGFAALLVTGTLREIFAGIMLWLAAIVLRATVRATMLVPSLRRLNLVSQRGDQVRRASFRLITILAVIGWFVAALSGFLLFRPVVDGLKALLLAEIPIGRSIVTPADLLIFPLVVWISFKVASFFCFVLDADVLPRMTLPRGVPAAASRLTRYVLIVIGVLVAFIAAGFNLDRVTIIFGALGVGIGFGLQSVVNNFVSGLILLFERPVQVGDRIQLQSVEGRVENIGLRASVVRAVGGSEIVVPNANLISSELVNWTLQDDSRRIEIPIGVAYGTDPETVMDLLVKVAEEQAEVASNPKPEALFLDYGDSSLDFTLRAWAPADEHLRVGSKLRVAITKALKEAGIEIPFPQRDLHMIP